MMKGSLCSPPPHSIEAEQAVLGGLVLDNSAWELIATTLQPSDFYRKEHSDLFQVIQHLAEQATPFDLITITEQATKSGIGNKKLFAYVAELASNIPSIANIEVYRDIIRERARLRRLISIGFECSRNASSAEADSEAVREQTEQQLFALTCQSTSSFIDLQAATLAVIDQIDKNFNSDSLLTGVDTGLSDLNDHTAGFQPADLVVLAARPSMGKTALAIKFVLSALQGTEAEKTVQFYSLEMPAQAIIYRLLATMGGVNLHALKTGKLNDTDWTGLSSAVARIRQLQSRLILDDQSDLTPGRLRAKARRAARLFGHPALIVIDYLQLMHSGKSRVENRNLEIAEISASLKALAKEMRCPVIALSQLNRAVEQRQNRRPNNGDLRESGAIEQDADLILFIYRDEHYNPESQDKGVAEIIIGKNRNGPTGMIRAAYIANQTRFENLTSKVYSQGDLS